MTNDELIKEIAFKLYPNTPLSIGEDVAKEIIDLVTSHNRQSLMDNILNLPATKHDRRVFYQLTEREL